MYSEEKSYSRRRGKRPSLDFRNLEATYYTLKLIDLCEINTRYQAPLNANGIFTPHQFLHSDLQMLKKQVFQSICGYYWFLRLRGWEIDSVIFVRKNCGQSYALGKKSSDPQYLASILIKLTEKMGRRLRSSKKPARGIHVAVSYTDGRFWDKGKVFDDTLFTKDELFKKVMLVFNKQPIQKEVGKLDVCCFDLMETKGGIQESLFEISVERRRKVSKALDSINDTWGTWTIYPALMYNMNKIVIDIDIWWSK